MIGVAVEWVGFCFMKMLTKGTLQHTWVSNPCLFCAALVENTLYFTGLFCPIDCYQMAKLKVQKSK